MSEAKQRKVLQALEEGKISEDEARSLLTSLKGSDSKVIDEMHPDLKIKDFSKEGLIQGLKGLETRAGYKNFAVNPEEGLKYLKREHPNLNFSLNNNGEVEVSGGSVKGKYKLDPSGFDLQDISDVAYDVPAGVLEGLASAAGGIGGGLLGLMGGPAAPVTAPAGALAGASAAGAATAGGLEAGRQGLGKYFGVAENYDTDRMKTAAAFGAASPLLFGTGAAGKQLVEAGIKKGLSKDALSLLTKSQSGAPMKALRGAKKVVAPRLGQLMSRIDKESLKWASKNLHKIEEAERSHGQTEIYNELSSDIIDAQDKKRNELFSQYGDTLDELGTLVDASEAEKPLIDLLAKKQKNAEKLIEKFGDRAEQMEEFKDYEHLQKLVDSYSYGDSVLKGREAQEYLTKINDLTGIRKGGDILRKDSIDKEVITAAKQVASNVDKAITKQAGGKELKAIKGELGKSIARDNKIKKYFADPEKTESTLNNLLSPKKTTRRKNVISLAEDLDVPIDEKTRQSIATSIFANPASEILSYGGLNSTQAAIPAAAAGGAVGYGLTSQEGGHGTGVAGAMLGAALGRRLGSPRALRAMMRGNRFMSKQKDKLFKNNINPTNINQVWQNIQDNER